MKKNKYLIAILVIIIICCILGITWWLPKKQKDNIQSNTIENSVEENTAESSFVTNPDFVIKSTKESSISKDEVEVVDIKMEEISSLELLEVEATLKNNSNDDIKGFDIEIELQDEKGNSVTSIAKDTKETIPAKGTFILQCSVTGIKNGKDIKKAKIITFEKKENEENGKKDIENKFNEMIEDFEQ